MPIFKHGWTGTPEHRAWRDMKTRCCNPKHPQFKDYGGRGIMVCDEWMNDFTAFLDDVGKRPSYRHSLDRVRVNGHYEPGNVRWATRKAQQRNRRISGVQWNGEVETIPERINEFVKNTA